MEARWLTAQNPSTAQLRQEDRLPPTRRIAKFCSNACRQAAYHRTPLSADDRQRLLTWELLQDAGIVPRDAPLPPRNPEVEQ
jgi:hypothetical protein